MQEAYEGRTTRSRSKTKVTGNTCSSNLSSLTSAKSIASYSDAPIKKVERLMKTNSFSESFNGRLEWKKRHYDLPVTSTPVENEGKIKNSQNSVVKYSMAEALIAQSKNVHSISPITKIGSGTKPQMVDHTVEPLAFVLESQNPATTPLEVIPTVTKPNEYNFTKLLYKYGDNEPNDAESPIPFMQDPTNVKTYPKLDNKPNKIQFVIKENDDEKEQEIPTKSKRKKSHNTTTNKVERSNKSAKGTTAKAVYKRKTKQVLAFDDWARTKNQEFEEVMEFTLIYE